MSSTKQSRSISVCLAVVILAAFANSSQAGNGGGEEVNKNRTFYLPVQFVVCPDLTDVNLWVEGDGTKFPPGPRTFQLTYFADKGKVLPSQIKLRAQALGGCDGTDLDATIVLTLQGMRSSVDQVEYDEEDLIYRLRTRRGDVHLPVRVIRIECEEHLDGYDHSKEVATSQ